VIDYSTKPEFEALCPTCHPKVDPETYVASWCGHHQPSLAGIDDQAANPAGGAAGSLYISGAGVAGGAPNRAICEALHRK